MSGKTIILSAPSGSGKTTLVKYLLENTPDLDFSISASTRTQRDQYEKEGKDYYFLSLEEFKKKIDNDEFIEWEEVYKGKFYGTLKSEVERIINSNKNIAFDIDVKGALNLKKYFGHKALAVFIKAPSIETLKSRLIKRATETTESLSKRISKAEFEMTFENKFDTILINDDIEQSKKRIIELYDQFKKK